MAVIELDVEIPDLASVEVETPDVEITPSSGESVLLVAVPGPPGPRGASGTGSQTFGETPAGTRDGVNTAFTTAHTFVTASTAVHRNGLREHLGASYTETTSNSITFTTAPLSDDVILIDYIIA